MLTQPEFPANRRRDPLRLAELRAYHEFADSDRAGRALYELKTARNVPELDFAALIEDVAVYGVQVKGGQWQVQRGQWQLTTNHGFQMMPCPIKLSWDAALQIRETVKRRLSRKVYVIPVLVLADMEPDPDIELRVENDRVKVLFGTDNLVDRLISLAAGEEIFNPPTAWMVDEIAEALMPFLGANGDAKPQQVMDLGIEETDQAEINVSGRPAAVRHADVVNVYEGPVTIYNCSHVAPDASVDEAEG